MRKIIFFLAISLITIQGVWAQFSIGTDVGINISNINFVGTGFDGYQSDFNYFASISLRILINDKISVNFNFDFSNHGYKFQNNIGDAGIYRYTYLILSPRIEYRALNIIGLECGVYTGIKLNEKLKEGGEWFNTNEFDLFKSSDYGLILSSKFYHKKTYVKFSYMHGIHQISNQVFTDENAQPIEANIYNRTFQVGIGHLFSSK